EWRSEQMRFFDARATDYDPKSMKGRAMRGALNNTLIALSEDPKNSSKTGMAMLVLAHKELLKSLGVADVKPEPNPKTKAEDKKPDAPLPDIKTLTDLPIAQQNESGGWMQELDKLTGRRYEDALEKLTDEQKNAYLARV